MAQLSFAELHCEVAGKLNHLRAYGQNTLMCAYDRRWTSAVPRPMSALVLQSGHGWISGAADKVGRGARVMSTFTVRHGKRYRAAITLGLLEQLASNETIAAKLRNAGFEDVHVSGQGSTRHAEALWPGPDTSAALPAQITSVSEVEES